MHYYLTPYVGGGTMVDPFRPRGAGDQLGWSALDLRVDGGKTRDSGLALLALPVRDDQPSMVYLGDGWEAESPVVASLLGNRLGVALAERTLGALLGELFIFHSRRDGTRWQPLQPTHQGLLEIWLGGERVFQQSQLAGGQISENWNCGDSASLTCQLTWTEYVGSGWTLTSSQAAATGGPNRACADSDLGASNLYAEATIITCTPGGGNDAWVGPLVRKDDTATDTAYEARVRVGAANGHHLYKLISGTPTQLGTHAQAFVANEVLRASASGSTIKCIKDGGDLVSVTDSAISTGQYAGAFAWTDAGSGSEILDNWLADVFSTAFLSLPYPHRTASPAKPALSGGLF